MDLIWETDAGELDSIVFDVTLREVLVASADVTEHAVETGANVSDHVRPSIRKATFEVVVSDSPSTVPTSQMFGVTGRVQSADLNGGKTPELSKPSSGGRAAEYQQRDARATAQVLQFDGEFSRRQRVYETLERLRSSATVVIATADLVQLEDCVISELTAPRETKDGDAIVFSLTLTQIRFAETALVEVPVPEEPRGLPPADTGATGTEELDSESTAYGLAREYVGGVFG